MGQMQKIKDFLKRVGWKKLTVALLVLVVLFFSGFWLGRKTVPDEAYLTNILNKNSGQPSTVDFAPFWKAWNIINEKYVATNNIGTSTTATTTGTVSDQTRVYGAISGMVDSLGDPYTEFFPPVENQDFNDQISGNFSGVGMEVGETNGVLTVIAPLKDTPAYNAGIKPGDQIIQIDNTLTSSLSVDDAINMIRGTAGTTVNLTLVRAGVKNPIKVSIVRETIDIPTLDTKTVGDVFVISLYSFSANSADLFRGALRDFVNSGDSKMIIDLRGNPGGYLDAAVDMASWFLPMGDVVVQEDYLNNTDNLIYRSKGYDIFNSNLKLAVLIDNGSASASEILAGALHDHGVATLVGEQSFGKGSVQELVDITPDTSLKVTVAKWLTPNGISISHEGLTPDVVVPLDETQFANGVDTQLNAAVQLLDK
jgi:carboxyl-terminal processing protease